VNSNVKSALVGGLAATFVVAASLAPKLFDHPSEVRFHRTASDEVTTTSAADATTTTAPVASTTTATTQPIEHRVTVVEQKVQVLESVVSTSTSTTTAPRPHLEAPTGFAWSVADGGLTMTWDAVPGAGGYHIYGTGFSGQFVAAPTVTVPFSADMLSNGGKIAVALRAYNSLVNGTVIQSESDAFVTDFDMNTAR
jgi:hypothetical protein